MLEQKLIDEIVNGTLNNNLLPSTENSFVELASVYEDEFQNVFQETTYCYLTVFDAFDRSELPYWDSYFDLDVMEEMGFTESRMADWQKTKTISDDDYRMFLRSWVRVAFEENTDWRYAIAALHPLKHSDGNECIALLSFSECGQGGWEFEDVFLGLFKTKSEAINHLKDDNNLLLDNFEDADLERYLNAVIRQ